MFGTVPGGSLKYYGANKKVGQFHDLGQEALVFSDIVKQFPGELHMTPEVKRLVLSDTLRDREGKSNSFRFRCFHAMSLMLLNG